MFRTASSATAFARCSRPALLAVAGRGVVTVGRDPFTQTSSSPGCVPGQSPRPAVQIAGLNPHTKIVATIGPASEQMPTLEQVHTTTLTASQLNLDSSRAVLAVHTTTCRPSSSLFSAHSLTLLRFCTPE